MNILSFVVSTMPTADAVVPAAGYFMDKFASYYVYLQILKIVKLAGLGMLVVVGLYVAYRLYWAYSSKKKR